MTRKPKPTNIKKLEGNPGRRKLNTNEPQPGDAGIIPPDKISPGALKFWKRLAPELHGCGLLTALDHDTLLAYCESAAAFIEATEMIKQDGALYETKNYKTVSPWVNIQNKALANMAKFGSLLGMSPSARSSVTAQVQQEKKPGDIIDGIFGN